MNPKYFFYSGYCVAFILLQVKISISEKWTVITSTGHLVVTVGGQAELSCQLSPSQSAENLEVQWIKSKSSKLVHLFRGGHEVNEDIAREYVNRTEFVKTAIGKGKLTLRLHNISVSDDGTYQCSFKGENFSNMASINLSVAALGLNTQVHVQAPGFKGFVMECNSGGWFPEPQMEWRNNKGEVIPHLSKSYSQDEGKLFHMKMTLFLPIQQWSNITCYIFNSLLGKGRHTNITLTDEVFNANYILTHVFLPMIFASFACPILLNCARCFIKTDKCFKWICWIITQASDHSQFFNFFFVGIVPCAYLKLRNRVFISDPFYLMYNNWIWDMGILILTVVIIYSILLIILYCTLKEIEEEHTKHMTAQSTKFDTETLEN